MYVNKYFYVVLLNIFFNKICEKSLSHIYNILKLNKFIFISA